MGPPRQSPVKFEKKLQMPQCQPIWSEVTRGSKPLFAHDTNGTEMLIRGVFFMYCFSLCLAGHFRQPVRFYWSVLCRWEATYAGRRIFKY